MPPPQWGWKQISFRNVSLYLELLMMDKVQKPSNPEKLLSVLVITPIIMSRRLLLVARSSWQVLPLLLGEYNSTIKWLAPWSLSKGNWSCAIPSHADGTFRYQRIAFSVALVWLWLFSNMNLLLLKQMMCEGAFHCCQDAELVWLIYWSSEGSFQLVDLFVQCNLYETVQWILSWAGLLLLVRLSKKNDDWYGAFSMY
jgi:hypothetical protein